ncbi:MAG TPA: cytochrome c [Acidiferrobacterales bacterium]|nr:cytochrome c [Acidiferrobacterales bacterium]
MRATPFWLAAFLAAQAAAAEISPVRQQALRHLLAQDCGSCHGLTLQGGLGPALTREALAGKSPEMLRTVILHGRPGTPMAPWQPFMSEAEAAWLVQQLLEGKAL